MIYNSPLVLQRADPFITKYNGKYYFLGSNPKYNKIEIKCADTINGLTAAERRIVWRKHDVGQMASHVWAPEMHRIMGKWVIYFAAGGYPKVWMIRPYTLVCDSDDPMTGNWYEGGAMRPAHDDPYSFKDFALDMTVFEHRGRWYTIWAQKSGERFDISDLYIAELENYNHLKTVRRTLSTPDYDWERVGFWVNEGPSVLKHNGKIYVTFSASATGEMYCMGLLSCDENADLLDPNNWNKRNTPVCATNADLKVFGPGHNCFVEGDEGELLCVLHFRNYKDIYGDPLDDHNRHAHVMKVEFDKNGDPVFDLTKQNFYNVPFENEVQPNINDHKEY